MGDSTTKQNQKEEKKMSKFASFVPKHEREKEKVKLKPIDHVDRANAKRLLWQNRKIRVANCCAETDMNGYTYTHALVSEEGIISCTECGQELEVKAWIS